MLAKAGWKKENLVVEAGTDSHCACIRLSFLSTYSLPLRERGQSEEESMRTEKAARSKGTKVDGVKASGEG